MAIEMTFEFDGQLNAKLALEILQINGFVEYEQQHRAFCAFHAESGLNAYFYMMTEPVAVLAQGLVPPRWTCKSRMIFRYFNENYEACEIVSHGVVYES